MQTLIRLALVFCPLLASVAIAEEEPTLVTTDALPGSRNTTVIYYDGQFLFMSRNFGDHRDFGGNTTPGLFVHSKVHDRWLQIIKVPTKDGKFGKSQSDDPEEFKLLISQVAWDFTEYAKKPAIELPLKTSGSIAFPEIDLDPKTDRFRLSFFTSWKVEAAVTRLYLSRKDLTEQFEKLGKP